MTVNKAPHPAFLSGGGELGELTRAKDWSQTAVGPPDQWPQSLRTMLSVMLNARQPMFLWWGLDRIQFYNDAYRLILGDKHPHALGSKGLEVWPEIWATLGPTLEGVFTRGEATWSENQLLQVNRHNFLEAAWFSYSHSPIYDESNAIRGIFCIVTETTDTMLADQQRKELDLTGQENERRLTTLFDQASVGVGIFSGPEFIVELANPTICELWGSTHQQVMGKPIFTALPEAAGQGLKNCYRAYTKPEFSIRATNCPLP